MALAACNSTYNKHNSPVLEDGRVRIHPSKRLTLLLDKRHENEKRTRIEEVEGAEIQLLGDDAFSNSPLNEIASSMTRWSEKNPGKRIVVSSLRIYYGEEEDLRKFEYKQSTLDMGFGPGGTLIGGLVVSLVEYAMLPRGDRVVVHLSVVANGKNKIVQHAQSPIAGATPIEMVAAALNFTGYKLSQELLN
ncbi:MAG: hypothetical protein RPU59_05425 [Candidatus Sedimenticola sp. (ex Thyasira tokunagai)]